MKKSLVFLAAFAGLTAVAPCAAVIGINFNNGDAAGAQLGTTTFGATWTDISDTDGTGGNPVGGTGVALNGTPATLTWSAANFWQAGSWTGAGGFNSGIGTMRVYIDDGAGGYNVSLSGMSSWLTAEGATGYTVTLYQGSDSAVGTGFEDTTVGGTIISIPELGDGTWDGAANDPSGNASGGFRGSATTGVLTNDVLGISANGGAGRGSLAAIVITAVPEPSTALLGLLGAGLFAARRRRK